MKRLELGIEGRGEGFKEIVRDVKNMGSVCGKDKRMLKQVIESKAPRADGKALSLGKPPQPTATPTAKTDDVADASQQYDVNRKNIKKKGAVIDVRMEVAQGVEARNAQVTDKPKTHWEVQMITMAVHRHSVLADLTEDAREEVINSMRFFLLNPNEIVFEQGGQGIHFFVVGSGSLEVLVNGNRVNVMKTGDSFGELALLHNTPRSATVKTLERCTLWGVDRKRFREAVEKVNGRNYKENKDFINSVPIFDSMTMPEKENLLAVVTTQKFQGGKKIVIEGEPGDLFYLIKEGTVSCSVKGVEIRKMEQGDYFGEQALLYNTTRTATVTAVDNVRVLSIGREQLREVLGTSLQRIIYRNTQRIALDQSEILSKLTLDQKEKLIDSIQISSYQDGDIIIPAQTSLQSGLYIVLKGGMRTAAGVFAQMFSVIGEREITEGTNDLAATDIIANGETDVAFITKAEFESTLGGDLSKISSKNEALAVLKKVSLFRGFSTDRLYQLLSVCLT